MVVFPRGVDDIFSKKNIVISALVVLVSILTLTPLVIKQVVSVSLGGMVNQFDRGWGMYFFGAMVFYLLGSSILLLIKKTIKARGVERKQFLSILIGIILTIVLITTFNFIFPAFLNISSFVSYGAVFIFPFIFFTAYAIIRHHLLDIKTITVEILVFVLSIISMVEVLIADNLMLVIFRSSIFLLILIFGIYLIKSIINEVKQREKLQVLTNELREASKKIKQANKELKRLDNAKSEFLSIASHQLRTPLTVVKGYVSMIQEGSFGKVPKKIGENLEKVYISTERLISLVESLLNISRIESGRLKFDIQPVDLNETVGLIVEGFQKKAKEKKLKLEFSSDDSLPKASVDPQKVKEIISNLIDNSIKYTKKGSITVGLHQESQSMVFACSDTGIGIIPEDLPRLFEKFVRGKGMMEVYTEGTGLGLYFARMVVENMGGRIWAESPGKNKGSKFSFSVPLADKGKAKKVK
jgi:signal transduction histidine kinase